jgi:uncharacterized protein (DUF488 family)
MLYTIGYSRRRLADIQQILDAYGALLVDIRLKADSRRPAFRQRALVQHFGPRYVHCPALGNVHYKGGPILLQDYEAGREQVEAFLHAHPAVVLMCVCAQVATCHRIVAGEQLHADLHVPLVHL